MPHRHTTYVDAAYCYRLSSVVYQLVCWSLSLSVVSPAKMAEPIEMLFGLKTRLHARNHVLDGGPDPRGRGGPVYSTRILCDELWKNDQTSPDSV